jgi:hypothetical protein
LDMPGSMPRTEQVHGGISSSLFRVTEQSYPRLGVALRRVTVIFGTVAAE